MVKLPCGSIRRASSSSKQTIIAVAWHVVIQVIPYVADPAAQDCIALVSTDGVVDGAFGLMNSFVIWNEVVRHRAWSQNSFRA